MTTYKPKRGQLPEKFKDYRVQWGPIGEAVYKRTYSQEKEDGRKESYPETVVRAVDGNLALVDEAFIEPDEREKLIELLLTFGALPAGRHLSASGMKGREFLFNCHAAGWDPQEPWAHFTFLFDQLMQGGGVGSNYSNRYLEALPIISKYVDLHIICRDDHPNLHEFRDLLSETYQRPESFSATEWSQAEETTIKVAPATLGGHIVFSVLDSREGWVDSIEHVLKKAYEKALTENEKATVILDVSPIRSRGKRLKTSGGTACGPGPLVSMLTDFTRHVNGCVGRKMTSLDAMVLDHSLASCVIAGGKRRSSRMSVKSWKDSDIFEFINCKREDGAHWSTNISVETDDDFYLSLEEPEFIEHYHAKAVMSAMVIGKKKNGEPGSWNRSLAQKGERDPLLMFCPNPCGEIGLQMWENCNLGHVNLHYFAGRRPKEMYEAFRLMTRWLIRATFGDIPQPRQRAVVDRNRRIGVGFFGFHAWLALSGIKYSEAYDNAYVIDTLKNCYTTVAHEGYRYSQQLSIPCPVKFTTLAPTGTVVLLPGTTPSGQAIIGPWYIRLVRYASDDPELAIKKLEGYKVFPDDDAANTEIVEYWCEDPLVSQVRGRGMDPVELCESQYDIPFETSVKLQAMLQKHWADNAISFTINLREEDLPSNEEMERILTKYGPELKGTTVFPERSRKNSPFTPISKAQWDAYAGRKEIVQMEDECRTGCPVK